MNETKPFIIPKKLVMEAYQRVKVNRGSAGIDHQSLEEFDKNLKGNLYRIWNRLSSGSYFPPPVMGVEIPKKSGGVRILGIPTVSDRIAQMVVKLVFEPKVEPHFHEDSYGYRPSRSALDAVGITRQRCWKYDWVLEFDIKGLFDNIDHTLLMKAVKKHTNVKWEILYIERWLKAPMLMPDGTCNKRTKGTPQGGVISPVLSNLFLHYVFDAWMRKNYPKIKWCRYADDCVAHCETERDAQNLLVALKIRFQECQLALHPEKTKIVYCKDEYRSRDYPNTMFTFLGYDFRRRMVKVRQRKRVFLGFNPAVSKGAIKAMNNKIRESRLNSRTELSLQNIAYIFNPILNGWIDYYGRYAPSALYPVFRNFNKMLVRWAKRKYKKLKGHKTRASLFIQQIAKDSPTLFAHWKRGMIGGFV